MKKNYILILFFSVMLFGSTTKIQSQTTEDFETETVGSQTFSEGGFSFTSNTANFQVDDFGGVSGAGSGDSDQYMDNFAEIAAAGPKTYTFTRTAGPTTFFTMQAVDFYLSSLGDASFPTDDGTLTIIGRTGTTVEYTAMYNTGDPIYETDFSGDNGFFNVDFTNLPSVGDQSNTNIDNIQFIIGGAFRYIAIDDFEFDDEILNTDPPEVQSIAIVGMPASTATSVDFLVTFNENANNVSTNDFSLDTVGTFGTIASVSASSGTSITVTVNGISGEGTISIDLNAGTDIADDLGNSGPPAFTAGQNHTVSRCFAETFESFTAGDVQFSSNGVDFTTATGTNDLEVEVFTNGGVRPSDKFLSNTSDQGIGKVYSITTVGTELFNVEGLFAYLSSGNNGLPNPTNDGDITFEGRLSGSTLYTIQKNTGFPTDFSTNNGFFFYGFGADGLTNIDELRITLGGSFVYLAIDDFEHCEEVNTASPPIVQSINLI